MQPSNTARFDEGERGVLHGEKRLHRKMHANRGEPWLTALLTITCNFLRNLPINKVCGEDDRFTTHPSRSYSHTHSLMDERRSYPAGVLLARLRDSNFY